MGRDETAPQPRPSLRLRIWRSIVKGALPPRTDRERARTVFETFILHLRPIRVAESTIRYTHTFGLGGMSLVLLTLLAGTGSLLMLAYQPVPGAAYESVTRLEDTVRFGAMVRAIHHWSANTLIVIAGLHLLRVFFTSGLRDGREFNWIIGLILLTAIAAANFTGYLLPWDQLSYWAVTIVTGMAASVPLVGDRLATLLRGGSEIGPQTLVIYFALHTQWLPAVLFVGAGFHFWRVRKAGGVVKPPGDELDQYGRSRQVLFLPHLLWRETAVALVLVAAIMLVSALFRAPLGDPANPGLSPNPAKAPWYFAGFQELLLHVHPLFAVVVLPLLGGVALLALPYIQVEPDLRGQWFLSARGRRTARVAALTALVSVPLLVILDEFVLGAGAAFTGVAALFGRGLGPTLGFLVVLAVSYRVARRHYGASRHEAIQALFVLLAVAFAMLTAMGIWFRGEGMRLSWP